MGTKIRALKEFLTNLDGRFVAITERSMGSFLTFFLKNQEQKPNKQDMVWIQSCHWMFYDKRKILCTNEDKSGVIDRSVASIKDQKISTAIFVKELLCLSIQFESGVLFAAYPAFCKEADHWSVRLAGEWWTFGPGIRLNQENAQSNCS